MSKSIRGYLENLFEYYFSNIIVPILTSLVIWNLNVTVSTTLKYCYKQAINKKLKLVGGAMKHFPKKLLGREIFRSMVSWSTNFFFWKIFKTLFPHLRSSYILNVRSLTSLIQLPLANYVPAMCHLTLKLMWPQKEWKIFVLARPSIWRTKIVKIRLLQVNENFLLFHQAG